MTSIYYVLALAMSAVSILAANIRSLIFIKGLEHDAPTYRLLLMGIAYGVLAIALSSLR